MTEPTESAPTSTAISPPATSASAISAPSPGSHPSADRSVSWWSGTRLAAGREVFVGFRQKSFWVTLAILLVASLAFAILPNVFGGDGDKAEEVTLALVGQAPPGLEDALGALAEPNGYRFEVEEFDRLGGADGARVAVEDGDVDVAIAFGDGRPVIYSPTSDTDLVTAIVQQAVASLDIAERLAAAGLTADEAAEALAPEAPSRVTVGEKDASGARQAIAQVMGLALYFALFAGGLSVATSVAVEKGARISEVVLSTLRPSQLLTGKVVGLGSLMLFQLGVVAAPVLISTLVGGDFVWPSSAARDIGLALLWFVVGYAMYATAYAALGSLVEEVTQVNSATTPLTAVLVVSYIIAVQSGGSTDSTVSVVASMVPFSAPMVMPVRFAAGHAGPAEFAIAMAGCIATAAVLMWLGSNIYRRAIVRTGRRLKLREVLSTSS